jgi:hypothetical protein
LRVQGPSRSARLLIPAVITLALQLDPMLKTYPEFDPVVHPFTTPRPG